MTQEAKSLWHHRLKRFMVMRRAEGITNLYQESCMKRLKESLKWLKYHLLNGVDTVYNSDMK